MEQKFIPFVLPDIGEEEIEEVVKVCVQGGLLLVQRPVNLNKNLLNTLALELTLLVVNSATAGLHLALEACGINYGDEVIVPH